MDVPEFIVATDSGMMNKLRTLNPGKIFIEAPTAGNSATCKSCAHCPWMAMNGLAGNIVGGVAWVWSFLMLGFFFGNVPTIKKNFTFVIIAIVIISILPGVIEVIRSRRQGASEPKPGDA